MKITGKTVVIGLLGTAVVFAAALWYFQNHAYYEQVPARAIDVDGRVYMPADWQGISASSSPIKDRACFRLDGDTAAALVDGRESDPGAEPLVAPYWFDCFDAGALVGDITAGRAVAVNTGPTDADGIDSWLALYPDGRAFLWHQVSEKFANQ